MGMVMGRPAAIITFCLAVICGTAPASAVVTRFEIVSREPVALGGRSFGAAGTVERIVAKATIALAPADRRNAVIVDIAAAPRNAQGQVEAMTDVLILRPAHPNGAIIVELPNRGSPLLMNWLDDASDYRAAGGGRGARAASAGDPGLGLSNANDAGNGFLLNQGFTLVWVGWQGDVRGGFGLTAPVAAGLTGTSRDLWSFGDTQTVKQVALSYPAAEPFKAKLT